MKALTKEERLKAEADRQYMLRIRSAAGFSMSDFAEALGVNLNSIINKENNASRWAPEIVERAKGATLDFLLIRFNESENATRAIKEPK